MNFIQSLKETAQQIIKLSDSLEERVHAWNQEKSAPSGGYSDRAGFVIFDDIELCADVYSSEDEAKSLLRARLAWSPKNKENQSLFTIITLDFNADPEETKTLIAKADNLTRQDLVLLLEDPSTIPSLVHVSLDSGKDSDGKKVGKRYEYKGNELSSLSEEAKSEFITILQKAYNQIATKA